MNTPLTLPIHWPRPTFMRPGAPTMLAGIPIFYDFDWAGKYRHSKSVFPHCKSIGRTITTLSTGKSPLLLLTDLEDAPPYRLDNTSDTYDVHIFNANVIGATAPDVARTLLGGTTSDASMVASLQRLQENPAMLAHFLHQQLTTEIIATWATADTTRVAALLQKLSTIDATSLDPNLALDLLAALGPKRERLQAFVSTVKQPALGLAGAVVNFAERYIGAQDFRALVDQDLPEPRYQSFLEKNTWIFGTHYVGRWPGRRICIGDEQDFILERVDGFYDVIELKRPSHTVLAWDTKHECYYPAYELARAIGQVEKYLANMDRQLAEIKYRDGFDAYRVRAIIVIGRWEEGADDEDRRKALRGLNSHLARIEIVTYTDLCAMADMIVNRTRNQIADAQTFLAI